jgi:glycogen debranching enzyme
MNGWSEKNPNLSLSMTEYPLDEVNTQQYYIATKSAPPDDRTRVLKYGKMFAVFDRYGDVEPTGLGEEGIFFEGTRFLSELALFIGKSRPLLLSSTIREDNCVFTADLTNLDLEQDDNRPIPRGTLLVTRTKFLHANTCYEHLRIVNYGLQPIRIPFGLKFNADFADIFEVRGSQRKRRGQRQDGERTKDSSVIVYQGLDGVVRRTRFQISPAPQRITNSDCRFEVALQPKQEMTVEFTVACLIRDESIAPSGYDDALSAATQEMHKAGEHTCEIWSSNEQFNDWMRRSVSDIQMMAVGNPEKGYPYAGVPWFSTVFGRDGIITALECLWVNPSLSRGVLKYLAATQAQDVVPESDAEPGKIIHETRRGEMAALGEVPFGRYYGSIDSTPLFVMLAGAYYDRTADRELLQSLWPSVESALRWIDQYGDRDGDGFVEYSRYSSNGLVQQGWKDSNDSVFHADGTLAEPPIALCEVQGYVYAAKKAAARMAAGLGKYERADHLEEQAHDLRNRFEEAFWCEDLGMYAIALDGRKRRCCVRTSNPGHCLYTRIAAPERAHAVAHNLVGADFFNGWGVRTVGMRESRYNPLSYHNGSVWPHDNAIVALGMSRYGLPKLAARVFAAFLDVSAFVDLHRLPELFCGLERRHGEGPTLYPVACAPQAWAAAAIYMLLEAAMGISVSALQKQVRFEQSWLPEPITDLRITNLEVGPAAVDLLLQREPDGVRIEVLRKSGDVDVLLPHTPVDQVAASSN